MEDEGWQMEAEGVTEQDGSTSFQVTEASLDLETFSSAFSGVGLLDRLIFVALHSPQYCIEALRIAHALVIKVGSPDHYKRVMLVWEQRAAGRPESDQPPVMDNEWLTTSRKNILMREERLDNDLKHFKSNTIKESIRRCYDELGDFHTGMGNLKQALKCYSRSRDYCATSSTVVEMCLNVIKVNIFSKDYPQALTYILKAKQTGSTTSEFDGKSLNAAVLTKLQCAQGVCEMCLGNYDMAAAAFLDASLDDFNYSEVLSPSNVAIYCGLCVMGTFNREQLQKVLSSASFKLFLELEPQMRDALQKFHNSKYSACLRTLSDMRANLLLDMYLSAHVSRLYSMIRRRAIVQYFIPYQCVSLVKMAELFDTSVELLVEELAQMILSDELSAKIDTQEMVLCASSADAKASTLSQLVSLGDHYHEVVQSTVIRFALKKHRVNVPSSEKYDGLEADRERGRPVESGLSRRRPHGS